MANSKVLVRNLYKIFGPDPDAAISLVEAGRSKDEIFEKTGMIVGVQSASFEVDEGEIFVVMGLSGSGKSTLIRMLNRLIEPTRGTVEIDGTNIIGMDREQLRQVRLHKMAMVFQHFALFPHRTVAANVEYGLKVRGEDPTTRRARAVAALEQVGLRAWENSSPSELSGGMQQRVGLARALAVDPEVLLMDEPFSALDPLIRRDMQDELLALQRQVQKTIVFITHDLHEALILGDRIAIMKEGRFVQVGNAAEIVTNPANEYVAAFTKDVDRGRVLTARMVMEKPEVLELTRDTPKTALERMNRLGRDALYVMDGERVAGLVTFRDLSRGRHCNGEDLCAVLRRGFPRASPDDHLSQIYHGCSEGLPVAVIGETHRLDGVIDPSEVFAMLSGPVTSGPQSNAEEVRH